MQEGVELKLSPRDISKICSYLPYVCPKARFHIYSNRCSHRAFRIVRDYMGGFYQIHTSEFPSEKVAALTDLEPSKLTMDDIKYVVRGIWKSDRVGFYRGFDELVRSGYASELILAMSDPASEESPVPVYPSPDKRPSKAELKACWNGNPFLYELNFQVPTT